MTYSSVIPYFLGAPPIKCFTTEQSTAEASLSDFYDKKYINFPTHSVHIIDKALFSK